MKSGFATGRNRKLQDAPQEDEIGTLLSGAQHIFSGSDTAVEKHRIIGANFGPDQREHFDWGGRAFELARTVARDLDGVNAGGL